MCFKLWIVETQGQCCPPEKPQTWLRHFRIHLARPPANLALILGNFMQTFWGFLELFQAPLWCTLPPNSGECILLVEERHCALPLVTGDSPDAVPHQPQPDLGGREAEGAVSREAATITCHLMSFIVMSCHVMSCSSCQTCHMNHNYSSHWSPPSGHSTTQLFPSK